MRGSSDVLQHCATMPLNKVYYISDWLVSVAINAVFKLPNLSKCFKTHKTSNSHVNVILYYRILQISIDLDTSSYYQNSSM